MKIYNVQGYEPILVVEPDTDDITLQMPPSADALRTIRVKRLLKSQYRLLVVPDGSEVFDTDLDSLELTQARSSVDFIPDPDNNRYLLA